MNGNDADLIENTLMFFEGRCGHQWVGATGGAFACPLCGDADGDNHLTKMQAISVQPDDWGTAWEPLNAATERRRRAMKAGNFYADHVPRRR
jgi:hypothetical protein